MVQLRNKATNEVDDYDASEYQELVNSGLYELTDESQVVDTSGLAVGVKDIDKGLFPGTEVEAVESKTTREYQDYLEDKYGSGLGNRAKALGEGLVSGATFGVGDIFMDDEATRARQQFYPGTRLVGEITGAVAPAILSGGTSAPVSGAATVGRLGRAGSVVSRIMGATPAGAASRLSTNIATRIGAGGGRLARIGGMAVGGGVEGALYGTGQGLSQAVLSDQDLDEAISTIGTNALIGGALGTATGGLFGVGAEVVAPQVMKVIKGRGEGGGAALKAAREEILAKFGFKPPSRKAAASELETYANQMAVAVQRLDMDAEEAILQWHFAPRQLQEELRPVLENAQRQRNVVREMILDQLDAMGVRPAGMSRAAARKNAEQAAAEGRFKGAVDGISGPEPELSSSFADAVVQGIDDKIAANKHLNDLLPSSEVGPSSGAGKVADRILSAAKKGKVNLDDVLQGAKPPGKDTGEFPLFINQKMRDQLKALGYKEIAIKNMKPEEALDILANNGIKDFGNIVGEAVPGAAKAADDVVDPFASTGYAAAAGQPPGGIIPPALRGASAQQRMPFVIPKAWKDALKEVGYGDGAIKILKPAEAFKILKKKDHAVVRDIHIGEASLPKPHIPGEAVGVGSRVDTGAKGPKAQAAKEADMDSILRRIEGDDLDDDIPIDFVQEDSINFGDLGSKDSLPDPDLKNRGEDMAHRLYGMSKEKLMKIHFGAGEDWPKSPAQEILANKPAFDFNAKDIEKVMGKWFQSASPKEVDEVIGPLLELEDVVKGIKAQFEARVGKMPGDRWNRPTEGKIPLLGKEQHGYIKASEKTKKAYGQVKRKPSVTELASLVDVASGEVLDEPLSKKIPLVGDLLYYYARFRFYYGLLNRGKNYAEGFFADPNRTVGSKVWKSSNIFHTESDSISGALDGIQVPGRPPGESAGILQRAKDFILGGAKKVGKKAVMPSAVEILNRVRFDGEDVPPKKTPDLKEAYEKTSQEVIKTSQNLPMLKQQMKDESTHPEIAAKAGEILERRTKFLMDKMPKEPTAPSPFGRKWQPSPAAIATWARYLRAVEDPSTVLEDMINGVLRPEGAEALRTVYASLFNTVQTELMAQAAEKPDAMSYARLNELSILFDTALHPAQQQEFLAFAQQSYQAPEEDKPPSATGLDQVDTESMFTELDTSLNS